MNTRIPLGWRERLDQLRREQDPRYYREDRPALQLPIPEPRERPLESTPDDVGQDHGVIVIDI